MFVQNQSYTKTE